jgi:signal transduction histidine kinase
MYSYWLKAPLTKWLCKNLYTVAMNAARPSSLDNEKSALTEAQWVRSASTQRLMKGVATTQLLWFFTLNVMVLVLYSAGSSASVLLAWFIANTFVSALRFWFLRGYEHSDQTKQVERCELYFKRYTRLVPLIGFIWGISIYLFYVPPSVDVAIFCLLIVVVLSILSVSILSRLIDLSNKFVGAYGLGLLSGIFFHLAFTQNFKPDTRHLWSVTIVVLFTIMLFRVGKRLNATYVKSLQLQYRNKQLIASLTEQRETTLAAVTTKNRLLASAAHDMRQPVLALDMYAGWLLEEPAAAPEIAPKIAASTQAVLSLFDTMFDMSRLTEGQITTHLTAVNLPELVERLFVRYQPSAAAKGLTLRTRAIAGNIFTDAVLLERLLGNLVSNAIKYTRQGGLLIAGRNTQQGVCLQVWDTGVGIPPEQQNLVFKEFYKSPSNKGTTDGFGLGLAIVTQLAALLSAEVSLHSRPNKGTVVSLHLGKLI